MVSDHLADLLATRAAAGPRAARGHDIPHGRGALGDGGAYGAIGNSAADADDHRSLLELIFTFKYDPGQSKSNVCAATR
jgi:hypothetical protein